MVNQLLWLVKQGYQTTYCPLQMSNGKENTDLSLSHEFNGGLKN